MNGDNVVIVWSAAAAGIGLVAKGGRDLYAYRKKMMLAADETARLLRGDPVNPNYPDDPNRWLGVQAAHQVLAAGQERITGRMDGMQVDVGEIAGRLRRVESLVQINGLNSGGIGDAVGRIEERQSGETRQQTLDQRKKPE